MAGVGEDDDWEGGQGGEGALWLNCADWTALVLGVACGVVVDDEDDEVADGDKGDDGGVFEGVEASQEGQWDDNQPRHMLVYISRSEEC